ncbi:MAG: pyruvate formate-lyase-activating protein [Bacillota bacterium]
MPIKGRVHSIETCGTVDGPGIRYILFLAGCPLRCKYCHNCDTWSRKNGSWMTVEEIMENLRKYKNYFTFSNGGITVSGGEPTLQWIFLTELFKQCKNEGIHTCLDTSGYCEIEKGAQFLPYTDLVLLDIKQMDDEKHKALTGVSNEKILAFAQYLSDKDIPVWLRYVLVPGYTDDRKDIEALCGFIKTLKNIKKVEILPYHQLGVHKWEEQGLTYQLKDVDPPSQEQMDEVMAIFKAYEIKIDELL